MAFARRDKEKIETDATRAELDDRRGGVWWPNRSKLKPPKKVTIDVLIPALNEEKSLGLVLDAIPDGWVRRAVVVDNGSTDSTPEVAVEHGAEVIFESQKGYGAACLAGIRYIEEDPPDILVFLDGDYSDFPEELPRVVEPILAGDAAMVIGSRTIGARQKGALLPQAVVGNKLACTLVEFLYDYSFSDLGPFRAVRWDALEKMAMVDEDFGWTVEMQIKAARFGIPSVEVPVSYRKRVGKSKITGTVKGTVLAGYKIIYTIFAQYRE